MGIGMLLVATQQPQFAVGAGSAGRRRLAAQSGCVRRSLWHRQSARALSRAAQSFRRGHRDFHRDARRTRASAGRARRRDHGGRASAERLRSYQHRERLDRELYRRADRHDHEADAAVIKWRVAIAATLAVVLAAPALFGERPFAAIAECARAPTKRCRAFSLRCGERSRRGGRRRHAARAGRCRRGCVDARGRGVADDTRARRSECRRLRAETIRRLRVVSTTAFALVEGDDLDVGLRLEDCGGWIVEEWHDHASFHRRRAQRDARELAEQGADRLRGWALTQPQRSANLFGRGAAVAATDKPTYFYAFFKTPDGNLRAYVRAGGPAYVAGLRSNDVIETIDGTAWWQFGTYPSEQKPYDGKPHSLERAARHSITRHPFGSAVYRMNSTHDSERVPKPTPHSGRPIRRLPSMQPSRALAIRMRSRLPISVPVPAFRRGSSPSAART